MLKEKAIEIKEAEEVKETPEERKLRLKQKGDFDVDTDEEEKEAEEEKPRDYQLERAVDLLRGLTMYGDRVMEKKQAAAPIKTQAKEAAQ